ncbi:unnamed protein product [Vitrella brassicaformis CCMP3155]|uniref:Uncharacterized protein n=2 Tax=Vitrella brassicaformis TaxID=1169539 RepID=A0A0G4EX93_VITBC|nr:unnamed protein product [Vitrella brassicaformis CCMP3155]|eukprot:CEM03622.1 unnamed protein product [Vitrella brassicaformis CCMP3155]
MYVGQLPFGGLHVEILDFVEWTPGIYTRFDPSLKAVKVCLVRRGCLLPPEQPYRGSQSRKAIDQMMDIMGEQKCEKCNDWMDDPIVAYYRDCEYLMVDDVCAIRLPQDDGLEGYKKYRMKTCKCRKKDAYTPKKCCAAETKMFKDEPAMRAAARELANARNPPHNLEYVERMAHDHFSTWVGGP